MNVVGLVTEYNPFHNGHAYHMMKSKEINNSDFTVVIMSGNYVQRGTPAIVDKYTRTKMALACGADLVLELPLPFATASAEAFSYGAVSILHHLSVVDTICFGSEYGDTALLQKVANYLVEEPDNYKFLLKEHLKTGLVFLVARSKALCACLKEDSSIDNNNLAKLLNEPNNILGIEYCKALKKLDSKIRPLTITRIQSHYHEENLGESISSATALRKQLFDNELTASLQHQMPNQAYAILAEHLKYNAYLHEDDLSLLLKYRLLYEDSQSVTDYLDVSKDLGKRIYNQLNNLSEYSSFVSHLKTKELTHTRIQRALLHILLEVKEVQKPSYVRILGLRKDATKLTAAIKKSSTIPLITSVAKAYKELSPESYQQLELEIKANNLYESLVCAKSKRPFVHEAAKPIIII